MTSVSASKRGSNSLKWRNWGALGPCDKLLLYTNPIMLLHLYWPSALRQLRTLAHCREADIRGYRTEGQLSTQPRHSRRAPERQKVAHSGRRECLLPGERFGRRQRGLS